MGKQRKKGWKNKPWSEADGRFLLENYGSMPTTEIAKNLGRTIDSIRANVRRLSAEVRVRRVRFFTSKEVDFLRNNYGMFPVFTIAKALDRTSASVEQKAFRLGLTKKPVAEWKYCIDCGDKLSRSSIYKKESCRCVKCSRKHHQDENHHLWKGGVSSLEGLVYSLLRPVWGNPIMQRDNYTCQLCGVRGGDKEVHHIKLLAQIRDKVLSGHPELDVTDSVDKKKLALLIIGEHRLEDGITLCKSCHKSIHTEKSGELLGTPNGNAEGNQQPSPPKLRTIVGGKVQRLTGEDSAADNPDTSARHATQA